MLNSLKQLFTKDILAKLLAILIALGLWVFVIGQETKIGVFPANIPIQVRNSPANFAAVLDNSYINLKITAPAYKWSRLGAESFTAFVDLEGLKEGPNNVEVKVTTTDPAITVLEKTPAKIKVVIDSIIDKDIPVKVEVEGKPSEDYAVTENVQASPETIKVTGAKSIVDNLLFVTATVNVDNEDKTVEKNVKLVALDDKNNPIQNLTFFPDYAKITVPIESASNTKTVGIKPIIIGEVAKNYWVEKVIADPSTTSILGDKTALDKIDYLETKPIDVTGINGGISNKVKLVIPDNVKLENPDLEINVKVFVKTQASNKQVSSAVSFSNLGSGLVVTNYEPKNITLTLSGDIDKLNSLPNIIATFNLSAQGPGSSIYNVSENVLNLPDGIDFISSSPDKVEFELEKK